MMEKKHVDSISLKIKAEDVRIYDNGGTTQDRYTAVYMDRPENKKGLYACVGMDENPFGPQGFGQHSVAMPGPHLGKRIDFSQLPEPCQKLVRQDFNEQVQAMTQEAELFKISLARAAFAATVVEQTAGDASKKIKPQK